MLFFPVNFPKQFEICFCQKYLGSFIMWVTKVLKQTLITMGSFKESKFKLTCCAGQGLVTIEVVMQKLKKS